MENEKQAFQETAEVVHAIRDNQKRIEKKVDEQGGKIEEFYKTNSEWKSFEERVTKQLDTIDEKFAKMNRPSMKSGDNAEEVNELYFRNIRHYVLQELYKSRYAEDFKLSENEASHLESKLNDSITPKAVRFEEKALDTETFHRAGALVAPPEFAVEIINQSIHELSPMRQLAKIKSISRTNEYELPTKTARGVAGWTAETGTRTKDETLTYGLERIPVHEHYAYFDASQQMLEDSAFNFMAEVQGEYVESLAKLESTSFISGNGINRPEGINTNASVSSSNQEETSTLTTGDGVIGLFYDLKEDYTGNAVWLMRRATMGTMSKLKGGDGQYLLGQLNSMPGWQLMGHRVMESIDMPAIAANAYPIAFGDFRRAYVIVDKVVATFIIVDPYTSKTTGKVEFLLRRRVGGQVVNPEAFRKLKIAVT
jgi:HK97 family phage major capsid protein